MLLFKLETTIFFFVRQREKMWKEKLPEFRAWKLGYFFIPSFLEDVGMSDGKIKSGPFQMTSLVTLGTSSTLFGSSFFI